MNRQKLSRRIVRGTGVLLVVTAFAFVVLSLIVRYQGMRAQQLAEVLASAELNGPWQPLRDRLKAFAAFGHYDQPAESREFSVDYDFDNYPLSFLHLASRKQISISISVSKDKIVRKQITVRGAPRYNALVEQAVRPIVFTNLLTPAEHRHIMDVDYGPYMKIVRVVEDESASSAQVERDWRVDLSCFGSFHSCSDPRSILRSALSVQPTS